MVKKLPLPFEKLSAMLSVVLATIVVASIIFMSSVQVVDVASSSSFSDYSDADLTIVGDKDVNPSDINYNSKQSKPKTTASDAEDGEKAGDLLDDSDILVKSVGQINERYGADPIGNNTVVSMTFKINDASASDGNAVFKKTEAKIENRANRLFDRIKSEDANAKLISVGKYTIPYVVISAKAQVLDAHINDEEVSSATINGFAKKANSENEEALNAKTELQTNEMRASGIMPYTGRSDLTTNTLQAWKAGYDGSGVNIAVIDSGFDYTHKDFGGAGNFDAAYNLRNSTDPNSFASLVPSKFIGGYDFAGSSYCLADGNLGVESDANYIVGSGNPHGSHVTGIAAGYGETLDGETFNGNYADLTDNDLNQMSDAPTFSIAPGTAPKANVLGLKVGFDDEKSECAGDASLPDESIMGALEYVASWNLDHETDGKKISVINMSLGAILSSNNDPYADIKTTLFQKFNVLDVVAAGNEGDIQDVAGTTNTNPLDLVVGATWTGQKVTTGADLFNSSDVQITDKKITGTYSMNYGGQKQLQATEVVKDSNFDSNKNGCGEFTNAVNGKIVYLLFGDNSAPMCKTGVAYDNAQAAGAAGIIQKYVQDDEIGIPGGNTSLPGMFIYNGIGDSLDDIMTNNAGVKVAFDYDRELDISQDNSLINVPATFTSRGHHGEQRFYDYYPNEDAKTDTKRFTPISKPDVSAPGVNIISVSAGSSNKRMSMSGTSMATPHVCGLAALVYQSHPNWKTYEIRADIIGTSKHDVKGKDGMHYGITRSGVGVVDSYSAVKNQIIFSDYTLNREDHYAIGDYGHSNSIKGFVTREPVNELLPEDSASDKYVYASDSLLSMDVSVKTNNGSSATSYASFGIEQSKTDRSIIEGKTYKFEYVPLVQLDGVSYSLKYKTQKQLDFTFETNTDLSTYKFEADSDVSSIDISVNANIDYDTLKRQRDPSRSGASLDGTPQDYVAMSEGYIKATCVEGCQNTYTEFNEYRLPVITHPKVRSSIIADKHYFDFSRQSQTDFNIGFNGGCFNNMGSESCNIPLSYHDIRNSNIPQENYRSALVPLSMQSMDFFQPWQVMVNSPTVSESDKVAYLRKVYDNREDLQSFGISSTAPQLAKQGKDISKGLLTFGWSFWDERSHYYLGDVADVVMEVGSNVFELDCSSDAVPRIGNDGKLEWDIVMRDMPICYLLHVDKAAEGGFFEILGQFPLNSLGFNGEDDIPESRFDTKVNTVSIPLNLLGVTSDMTNFPMRYGLIYNAPNINKQETFVHDYDALDPDVWFEKENSKPVVSQSSISEHGEALFFDDSEKITVHRKENSGQNIMFFHMQNANDSDPAPQNYDTYTAYKNKLKSNLGQMRQADIIWVNDASNQLPDATESKSNNLQISAVGADGYFSSLNDGVIKNGTVWQSFIRNGHKLPDSYVVEKRLSSGETDEDGVISANNFSGHYGQGAVLFGNPTNYNKSNASLNGQKVINSAKYTVLGKGNIPSKLFDSIDANHRADDINESSSRSPAKKIPDAKGQSTSLKDNELLLFAIDVQSSPIPFTSSITYSQYGENMIESGNAFDYDGGSSTLASWFKYTFATLENFSQIELNSVDKTKLEGVCNQKNNYFNGENCNQNGLDLSKSEYQFFPLAYGDIGDPGRTFFNFVPMIGNPKYYNTGDGNGMYFDQEGGYADRDTWSKHMIEEGNDPNSPDNEKALSVSADSYFASATGCKYDLHLFLFLYAPERRLCANGSVMGYWLRSPMSLYSSSSWLIDDVQGIVSGQAVDDMQFYGARSAFKLDRNSVLFTSQFGNNGYANELKTNDPNSGYDTAEDQDYKLTLINKELPTPKVAGHVDGDIFSLSNGAELELDLDNSLVNPEASQASRIQTRDASNPTNELAVKVVNHNTNEVVSYQKSEVLNSLNVPLLHNYNTAANSPLSNGIYDVYIWNQVDHYNRSDEGSLPVKFQVYIGGNLPNTGVMVTWMIVCLILVLISLAFNLRMSARRYNL